MATSQSLARKRLLEQELARYLDLLIEYSDPEQILVFGSLATGEIHPWSDIDLLIIQETDQPFLQRLRRIRRLIQPKVGTDILVYTPAEFEQLRHNRLFFQEEVLAKSQVIYERKR